MYYIGIDIAKQSFDLAIVFQGSFINGKFDNNSKGFAAMLKFLKAKNISDCHFCMEATGGYQRALATFLFINGFKVSVINPAQIKFFGNSYLQRNKTDKADAQTIALFCQERNPPLWQPLPLEVSQLQDLISLLDSLQKQKQAFDNQLLTAEDNIKEILKRVIKFLATEITGVKNKIRLHINKHEELAKIDALLQSIDGVGEVTSTNLLALFAAHKFDNARQVAAFAGVNVRNYQSGSSINKKPRMSKMGDSRLRKALYMPSVVIITKTEWGKRFRQRLEENKKCAMVILGAMMRKLLHIAYGVLKSGKPFNPALHLT